MSDSQNSYPKSITLSDGAAIEIRNMTVEDREAILSFAQGSQKMTYFFYARILLSPMLLTTGCRILRLAAQPHWSPMIQKA